MGMIKGFNTSDPRTPLGGGEKKSLYRSCRMGRLQKGVVKQKVRRGRER